MTDRTGVAETTETNAGPVEDLRGLRAVALVWFPLVGSIGAWTMHVLYIAGATRWTCNDPSMAWTMHAMTAAMVAVCLLCLSLAWHLARSADVGPGDHDLDRPGARRLFLGKLGVIVSLFNLAVIILEELYVLGLHPVRCGG
jgi:hypothetical protein